MMGLYHVCYILCIASINAHLLVKLSNQDNDHGGCYRYTEFREKNTQFGVAILDLVIKMISYSIFSISIAFYTLKNPQNDTKIIILPLLVKKLWNGLKRMAAILFLCKWGQKVLVGHASMSEMICMTINYNHAKLNNSTPICRVLSLTRPTINASATIVNHCKFLCSLFTSTVPRHRVSR